MRRNYHRKLWGEIITGNYEEKLSQEIIRRNYHRKLWEKIITGNDMRWRVREREIHTNRGEASTDHPLGEGLG